MKQRGYPECIKLLDARKKCRQRGSTMYRKCATEHSSQNQRTLENAFLVLLGRLPYEQVTITQICEEAGISRRVFYHLFGSKQDLLYSLIDHRILDIESFRTDVSNMALRFFLYWKEQKPLLDAIREHNLWSTLMDRMIGSILREDYDVWRWLQAENPDNRQDIVMFNIGGCMALVFSWHDSEYQKSPEQMAALIADLMNKPLARQTT